MTAILCTIFFLSGASALIFELLWFQLAGLTFGNSVWATALVLASFMGGLALGSALTAFKGDRIKSPIRLYALLEIIIGVTGFLLVLMLPNLTKIFVPLYRMLLDHGFILNSIKAVTAFFLMLIPACAMGATLPVLVKTLHKENPGFGRVLGILYGWNTFGATAGVLVAEFFLVKWLGIRQTALAAAGFNILAAAAAFAVYTRKTKQNTVTLSKEPEKVGLHRAFSYKSLRLLAAAFLSGMTLLALEVIWFRFMLLFFGATTLNFTLMLTMVLLGISLGGMAASRWFRLNPDAHRFLLSVLILNGILVVLLYTNFGYIRLLVESFGDGIQVLLLALFLIFPVSFLSGIIFTMLGKALHNELDTETKAAGLLTTANTTGGMIGSLIAGFVFIPYIGVEKSFFLFALSYGLIALLVFGRKQVPERTGKRKPFLMYAFAAVYLISLVLFPFGFMEDVYLRVPFERYSKSGEERVSVREGVTETIQYLQKNLLGRPYYHRLITNNHSMSGTSLTARRYMKAFVYWPAAVHPNMKKALLLCFGCGMTAKALTDTKTLESIDIVDISRDIIEESKVVFPDPKENPVHDPRVKIHIEDGRFFLLTRERRFDLITAEPPPPKFKGIVNLYSREFFQLIHDRLADGGIVTYWLPVYQMSVSEAKSVLKAFSQVFPDCSLWAGAGLEWMMSGVRNPGGKVTDEEFIRQWNNPVVGREMRILGFDGPEQLGAFFIADGTRLEQWVGDAQPLEDNYPKRMSPYFPTFPLGADADDYVGFMNHPEAAANFLNSNNVKKIWPDSMRIKSENYFDSAHIINEILIPRQIWSRLKNIYYLHRCLHDPFLNTYIPWVLGSNQQAQDIIAMFREQNPGRMVQNPDTYIHLAAGALLKRNYLLSEHYLRLTVDDLSRGDFFSDDSRFNYCTLRMYLLFIGGQKEQAKQVADAFLNYLEKEQGKAARDKIAVQFENYLLWLQKVSDETDE